MVMEVIRHCGSDGIVCLAGISSGGRAVRFDVGGFNRETVLRNDVVFGTVNANRQHFEEGVRDMAVAEARWPGWLPRLITHRVQGLDTYEEAFELLGQEGAIKVVVEIALD